MKNLIFICICMGLVNGIFVTSAFYAAGSPPWQTIMAGVLNLILPGLIGSLGVKVGLSISEKEENEPD